MTTELCVRHLMSDQDRDARSMLQAGSDRHRTPGPTILTPGALKAALLKGPNSSESMGSKP